MRIRERYFREQRFAERDDESELQDTNEWFLSPKLVVIRLGLQHAPNKPLPDVIHEMVQMRETTPACVGLGTWLVLDKALAWGKGLPAYSETLDAYLKATFEAVDLTPKSDAFDPSEMV